MKIQINIINSSIIDKINLNHAESIMRLENCELGSIITRHR